MVIVTFDVSSVRLLSVAVRNFLCSVLSAFTSSSEKSIRFPLDEVFTHAINMDSRLKLAILLEYCKVVRASALETSNAKITPMSVSTRMKLMFLIQWRLIGRLC